MKPFLGIDITSNQNNKHYNGDEFIAATASEAQIQALEDSIRDLSNLNKRAMLPYPLIFLQIICLLLGIVPLYIIKEPAFESSIKNKIPWILCLSVSCLTIFVILEIVSRKKKKTVMNSDEGKYISSKPNTITDGMFAGLGVPSDAAKVDILSFKYKLKGEKPVAKAKGIGNAEYTAYTSRMFVDDKCLYISQPKDKYAFPLCELRSIHTIKKHIRISNWTKDIPYNKGIYKAYKIRKNHRYKYISIKPYHILEVKHEGETWGIYFPSYELPVFEALTGLKAEQQ